MYQFRDLSIFTFFLISIDSFPRSSKMKRYTITTVLMILLAVGAMAQDTIAPSVGSYYMPGTIATTARASLGFSSSSIAVTLEPTAEYFFYKLRYSPVLPPFDFAAFGTARAGGYLGTASGITAGLAGGVSIHAGFRGYELIPGLEKEVGSTDLYVSVGLGFNLLPGAGLVIVSTEGVNYFLSDTSALGAAYTYWGSYSAISVTATITLGGELEKLDPTAMNELKKQTEAAKAAEKK